MRLLHKSATSIVVCALAFFAVYPASADVSTQDGRVPNIVLILADDLGFGDLGCYGQKEIETPSLDRMAREGMRFTNFYAGATVCAPSRCVLMTGLHTGHCVVRGNAGKLKPEIQDLRDKDVTMAEVLQQAGYATSLCGKWGLGDEGSAGIPTKQGFNHFFGYLNQHHALNYYPAFLFRNTERVPLKNVVPGEGPFGSNVATSKVEYSHDVIAAEALQKLNSRATDAKPFFLYLALTLPHANNEAKKEGMEVPELGKYANRDWPSPQKGHAAMVTLLDTTVGRVLKLLKERNLDENTLVIFSSDNGPHAEGGNDPLFNDSNGPLKGKKRDLTDGGIRVPFIARWPGKIQADSENSFVGGFQDLLPTFAELAQAQKHLPKNLDGLSIVPTLLGQAGQQQHDHLYWAFYEGAAGQALRQGKWKAIQQPYHSPVRLYDITSDPGEEHDLAAEHPALVRELATKLNADNIASDRWKFPEKGAKK